MTAASLRDVEGSDLDAVARLHLLAFPSTELSRAGSEVVKRYYETQWARPHSDRLLAGIWEDDTLVAFICAGFLGDAVRAFLHRHRWYLVHRLAVRPWLFVGPQTIDRLRLALGRRARTSTSSSSQPRYRVLSVATHPEFRGRGLAQQLLSAAEEHAQRIGETEVGLTVEPDNGDAVALYRGRGWEPIDGGSDWTGSMRKTLDR